MDAFDGGGLFFLPGREAGAVRGRFTFDGERSHAGLHDPLVPFTTKHGQSLAFEGQKSARHPVIYGVLDNGDCVTLLDARSARRDFLGSIETWDCLIALKDDRRHAATDSFDRVTMRFDCLRAWAEPPSVTVDRDFERPVLDTSWQTLERATLSDAEVTLGAGVNGRWGELSVEVQRVCNLGASFLPTTFQALVTQFVFPLQELLVVLLGRSVRLEGITVHPVTDEFSHSVTALYQPTQPEPAASPTRESLSSWGHPTAYLRTELPVRFEDLVPAWLDVRQAVPEAVTLLCGPTSAPFMYLEHRYSAAFQGAEKLATARFGGQELDADAHTARVARIIDAAATADGVSQDDIAWAKRVLGAANNRRLIDSVQLLLEHIGPIGADILRADPEFSKHAVNARADVAHPSRRSATSRSFYWYCEALTWIVRADLLHRTGVPMEHLHQTITRRGHFTQVLDALTARDET